METHVDAELREMSGEVLIMASYAESAVNNAFRALASRDEDLAFRIIESDRILDEFEIKIDDLVVNHLIKAPLATDLRLVTRIMKISKNLERVGDEATKIAKRARELVEKPPVDFIVELSRMAVFALDMLKAALNAFANRDAAAARAIIPRDKEVDLMNKQNQRSLTRQMIENPDTISRCLLFMDVSKSLERIADHATNVAESVVYLCKAEDIRHSGAKEISAPA